MSCRKASPRRRGKAGNGSLSSARNTRGRSDSVLAANAGCLITFVHGAPSLGAYTRYWIAALDRVTHPTTFFSRSKRRKSNGKLFTDHRRGRHVIETDRTWTISIPRTASFGPVFSPR